MTELDKLSRKLLPQLMRTDEFQEIWAKVTLMNQIMEEQKGDGLESEYRRMNFAHTSNIFKENDFKCCPKSHQQPTAVPFDCSNLREGIRRIAQALNVATDTFLIGKHSQMARFEHSQFEFGPSRDAVSLYSAHIRLDHFCSSTRHFTPNQISLLCRQISTLICSFTKSVSSVFSIERCTFLANRLAHLVTKFYETALSRFHDIAQFVDFDSLKSAIIRFNGLVCETLNEMLAMKRVVTNERRVSLPMSCLGQPEARLLPCHLLNRSNSMPQLQPVLTNGNKVIPISCYGGRINRQRSFLISPELEYNRRIHSRSGFRRTANKSPSNHYMQNKNIRDVTALKEVCRMALSCIDGISNKKLSVIQS